MSEPSTQPPEKPFLALGFDDATAVDNEVLKIEGATDALLHLVDSLDENAASAVGYLAEQLSAHRASLEEALARGRGSKRESGEPLPRPDFDAGLDTYALCQQAARAWETVGNSPDGTPAHEKARAEGQRLNLELDQLRARTFAKPDKTWDDLAVLAILALHWDRGEEIQSIVRTVREVRDISGNEVLIGERALPTLYLAVLEVLGIRLDTFTQA